VKDGDKKKKASYMPGGSMAAFFKQSSATDNAGVSIAQKGKNLKATMKA
jgi:hypothetical protein